jgi:hypothetical protein
MWYASRAEEPSGVEWSIYLPHVEATGGRTGWSSNAAADFTHIAGYLTREWMTLSLYPD